MVHVVDSESMKCKESRAVVLVECPDAYCAEARRDAARGARRVQEEEKARAGRAASACLLSLLQRSGSRVGSSLVSLARHHVNVVVQQHNNNGVEQSKVLKVLS